MVRFLGYLLPQVLLGLCGREADGYRYPEGHHVCADCAVVKLLLTPAEKPGPEFRTVHSDYRHNPPHSDHVDDNGDVYTTLGVSGTVHEESPYLPKLGV